MDKKISSWKETAETLKALQKKADRLKKRLEWKKSQESKSS